MATYKGIKGFSIQNLSADPNNPIEGEMWYNSTSNVWKVEEATTVGAWATGNSMGTARYSFGGNGTQTAALAVGGLNPPTIGTTEKYDGTSWTATGSLNTARAYHSSEGTQTAAVAFGGNSPAIPGPTGATENFNGTSWTNSGSLNTPRMSLAGAGTQTAALAFAGQNPGGNLTSSEEYDGATWTSGNPVNTARRYLSGCGTQTAGLAGPGPSPPPTIINQTELYDGTSWTTSPAILNTERYTVGLVGTQTLALAFGGSSYRPGGSPPGTPALAETELWDGTSWTSTTSLNTARRNLAGAGTQSSAVAFGGGGTAVGTTEDWTGAGAPLTQTITVS